MDLLTRDDNPLKDFHYYNYTPSMAAAVLFIILFLISTALHWFQMFRWKNWFMIPFCIGGIFEVVGYIGRALASKEAPNFTLGPYIIQAILLLVAPALFAASIYMDLSRVVLLVDGESELFIRRRWLTRIFVSGDIFSFLLQSSGGGLMAGKSTSSINIGKTLVLIGLVVQLIYFGLFVIAAAIFHRRIAQRPTEKRQRQPWRKHLYSLYAVSALILVRSIVRVAEYAQGFSGYIISHEIYLYVFDALPMFSAMVVMNVVHPGEISAAIRGYMRNGDVALSEQRTV